MYELFYKIAIAIGTLTFVMAVGLFRLHDEIPVWASLSFIIWALVAVQSSTVQVMDQTGTMHTVGDPGMQFLAAGFALVSALAAIGSYSGQWTPGGDPL